MSLTAQTFEIEAESGSLGPFRQKLRSFLESASFDAKRVQEILLSVDEVLTNIIRHGYGGKDPNKAHEKIRISFSDLKDRGEIVIEDGGPGFNPCAAPLPKLPSEKPGGLGIYLVRTLMDELHYEPLKPKGNRLRLVKYKQSKERNPKP